MIRLNQYKYKEEYTYYMLQSLKSEEKDSFRKDFLDLHPMDQATFFIELSEERRFTIYSFLTPSEFGDIFSELEPSMQKKCILELDRPFAVAMLNELPSDDAADFFGLLSYKEADYYLEQMEKDEADDIKQLLQYEKGSAGALMTKDVVIMAKDDLVIDVFERLKHDEADAETFNYLYITDSNNQLLGVVSLRDLIISPPESLMGEIMNSGIISVTANTSQPEVFQIIRKYGLLAVPVVTENFELLGIITFDDVLTYL